MKKYRVFLGLALVMISSAAHADGPTTREYSRKGEISPNTEAPSLGAMIDAIEHGSPERLKATLEYGERVLCEACVPLLENRLLESGQPRVREMAAWWLRRQPFAAPHLLAKLRKVVREDESPQRRARAAEALGEFMDPHVLPELSDAALADADPGVRSAAVRGLARLNSDAAGAVLPDALKDKDVGVRLETLGVLLSAAGFRDYAALLPLLGDTSADVRTRAARLCGEYRLADAETALVEVLLGDPASIARKAAAWALGRIGGAEAKQALVEAQARETDARVLDAISIAQRMK
jgi:HEAT repeat protein